MMRLGWKYRKLKMRVDRQKPQAPTIRVKEFHILLLETFRNDHNTQSVHKQSVPSVSIARTAGTVKVW